MVALSLIFKVMLSSPPMAAGLVSVPSNTAVLSDTPFLSITSGVGEVVGSPVGSTVVFVAGCVVVSVAGSVIVSVPGCVVVSVTGSVVVSVADFALESVIVSSSVSELPTSTEVSARFVRAVGAGVTVTAVSGSTVTSSVGFSVTISSPTGAAFASKAIADIGIAPIRQTQHNSQAISLRDNPLVFLLLLFIEIPPALSISTIQAHIILFISSITGKRKSSIF